MTIESIWTPSTRNARNDRQLKRELSSRSCDLPRIPFVVVDVSDHHGVLPRPCYVRLPTRLTAGWVRSEVFRTQVEKTLRLDIFRRSRSGRDITRHVIESVKEHHKVLPIDGVFAEDAHLARASGDVEIDVIDIYGRDGGVDALAKCSKRLGFGGGRK